MMNKQNLWFLTLFSLILVLSVYYITMPNELLLANNSAVIGEKTNTNNVVKELEEKEAVVAVEESEILMALRVNLEEERATKKKELQSLLTDQSITSEEKNNAYVELQVLNQLSGKESTLENKIKQKYNLSAFVKVQDNEITVVIDSDKHDTALANNIMRSIQEEYDKKMYITVQFK